MMPQFMLALCLPALTTWLAILEYKRRTGLPRDDQPCLRPVFQKGSFLQRGQPYDLAV